MGFLWGEEEIEENIPDAGAHIFDPDRGGKCVTSLQALNHRGTETVITHEGIAAAEDQDGGLIAAQGIIGKILLLVLCILCINTSLFKLCVECIISLHKILSSEKMGDKYQGREKVVGDQKSRSFKSISYGCHSAVATLPQNDRPG